jgi:hypothetical protein
MALLLLFILLCLLLLSGKYVSSDIYSLGWLIKLFPLLAVLVAATSLADRFFFAELPLNCSYCWLIH